MSEWKKKEIEIPSRIDEVSRKIVEVDYTETEIKLAGLRKELAEVSEVGADQVSKYQEIADIKGKIIAEKSKLQEIEMNGKQAASKDKFDLQSDLSDYEAMLRKAEGNLSESKSRKSHYEKEIAYDSEKLKKVAGRIYKSKRNDFR